MNTIITIITLQLLASGVVIKHNKEIHLTKPTPCDVVMPAFVKANKDTDTIKILSLSCKTTRINS